MATDSTNLPQGGTTLDAGMDMAGGELDLTNVQLAQTEPAEWVDLPKGNVVILLPVQPGQAVRLPTDSADGLLAKIGPEGNLAIVVDGRTIILQGYLKANDQSPVKIVTNDGDAVNVADLVAATDTSLDIQTAAGPATGGQGEGPDGSGIYIPFLAGPGLGGLNALGVLDPTQLQYRLIDDEERQDVLGEDTSPDFTITFDVLSGIVNEDDLPADEVDDVQTAKLIFKEGGNDGEGNDPFDGTDRDDNDGDDTPDESDDNLNGADPDREPLSTVATVKVDFHGDVPGKLEVDLSKLPAGLTSEGQKIVYAIDPAVPGLGGHGNGIFGYIESGGTPGYQEGEDRLVFEVHVDKYTSDSEFKVTFTLHDNIDNTAPDANGDGAPDLLGANEQLLDLPVHFKITDSDGSSVTGTLPLGVQDDVPAFGEVVGVGANMEIIDTVAEVTHDESKGPQSDDGADDQSFFDFVPYPPFIEPNIPLIEAAADLYQQVIVDAGFSLPFGDSVGALLGAAQSQVKVSFGADGASQEYSKEDGRDSVFGAVSGSGENERPFELFMIDPSKGGTPAEDDKSTGAVEGNLTAEPQKTNLTVTWNGGVLPVYLIQFDANTIVGYIETGQGGGEVPALQALGVGAGKEAVLVIDINDSGVLSFFQLHQLNHADPADRDEKIQILAEDGETPLVYVRASDFDGDHAIQPVTVEIQDDAPKFVKVFWGFDHDSTSPFNGVGLIDEDKLPHGNYGGPGDDKGGRKADSTVVFDFGADKPGHLEIAGLTVKDSANKTVLDISVNESGELVFNINDLQAIDGKDITVEKTTAPGGLVIWTAYIAGTEEKVFTFSLDTEGAGIGDFDFCLHQPLEHPYHDLDSKNDGPLTSYEDNFKFDFTVRGYDVDGDHADGHVKLSVDDDSPDACKVEISFGDHCDDNKLVHDETRGKQDGGNDWNDPDASGQPEDDIWYQPKSFEKFEESLHCADAIGYAKTKLNIDLSGGTCDPNAAYGADGPGSVSPVSIVNCQGGNFCGEKTNLKDTKTGCAIFLYTVEECGETFVVGKVGGKDGPIAFALHVSDSGNLEMAQYRAIGHPDECDRDDSVTLLDCNGNSIIYLQVIVTDADGDTVTAKQAVDGCHGNPAIVFQDDGPCVECADGKVVLAMDETDKFQLFPSDHDQPGVDNGPLDGSTTEGDWLSNLATVLEAIFPGPLPHVLGAAKDNVTDLFKVKFGTDGGCVVCYDLTILNDGKTNLVDTESGTCITLCKGPNGIVEGRDGEGNLVFAICLDKDSGEIVSVQFRAIDHGDEEGAPGAHDEVTSLLEGILGVTATAFDKDGDKDSKTADIGCGIIFEDDGPKFEKVDWGNDGDSTSRFNGTGLIDEDALPHGIPGGPGDDQGGKSADGKVVFDFGSDRPGKVEINALEVKDHNGNVVLKINLGAGGTLVASPNALLAIDDKTLAFEKSAPDANGVVTWTAYIAGCPGEKVFTFSLDTCGDNIGEFDFCLLQPLEHPLTDNPQTQAHEKAFEDNFKFDFTIRGYDGDGDSADGHVKLSVDDDSPKVEACEGASLCLAMDETDKFQLFPSDHDQPGVDNGPLDGPTTEGDWLSNLATVLEAIFSGPLPHVLGAAKDNVQGLFKVGFGADGGCEVCYDLTILGDGKTNLRDTESGTCISLVDCGGGVVKGVDECGNVVFALWLDHDSGDIISAQFRAIDHGGEEGAPGAHDEIKTLCEGVLGITATATDNDGDKDCKTVDIGKGIKFEDDGPKFEKVDWGNDGDSTSRFNGTGQVDEDALPGGIVNGPGDGSGNNICDGQILFDFGSDRPGTLSIAALTVTNGSGAPIALGNLKTADGHAIAISQTMDPATGVITLVGRDVTDNSAVFTLTLDGKGDNVGDFKFELHQPLEHPDSNNNNADDATDNGTNTYEDNLNFSFTVVGTDGDGDSATGQIKITIDDDSPKTLGKTEGCLDEACLEKTGECVSIDAGDQDVTFADGKASNTHIIITGVAVSGDPATVINNPDGNNVPGFGIVSDDDGGEPRHDEINYTGDGDPHDTPGEVMSVKLADPDALATCATVELSEFYNSEGSVEAERGQYQLYRDGVPVSGWITFVANSPQNGNPGSGILALNINGPAEGFDEIRFRAIIGSNDGAGGDSSDFNVKSAKFDLAEIASECITGPINGLYGADGPGDITLTSLPAITVGGAPVAVALSNGGHTATGTLNGEPVFMLTIDPVTKTYKFEIFSPIDNNPDGKKLVFGYNIVDADGDKVSSTIEITVKDHGKPTVDAQQAAAKVDEDGLPAGLGDSAPGDQPTDPAHNLPNESYWRGQIAFDASCDGIGSIALSTAGNATGLQTLDGQAVKTYWDAATLTLIGYVGGDANNAANKVFTITLDGTLDGSYVVHLLKPVKHPDGSTEDDRGFTVNVTVTDSDGSQATGSFNVNIDDDKPVANDDADEVTEDSGAAATGNVITGLDTNPSPLGGPADSNGSPQDGTADAAGADALASITWAGVTGGYIQGTYGKLYVDGNGNYKYVVDEALTGDLDNNETGTETFGYTITDKDGDTDTATLTITINGHTDAVPPTVEDATAKVDEDGIPGIGNTFNGQTTGDDNADVTPPDTAVPDEHVWQATLPLNWNGFPGTITLAAGTWTGLLTIDGHAIEADPASTPTHLIARDAVTLETVFAVEILNAATGEYKVTLLKPLLHPDSNTAIDDAIDFGKGSVEDNLTIPVSVTYTNAGGSVTKALTIDVDDDSPNWNSVVWGSGMDEEGAPLQGFAGIEGASAGDDFAGANVTINMSSSFTGGADGLHSVLPDVDAIASANSALRATDGTPDGAPIVFAFEGADLVARISEAGNTLNGREVIRIHPEATVGQFTVALASPIFHVGQGEQNAGLAIYLKGIDKDGDATTTPALFINLNDDMPDAAVSTQTPVAPIVLDESPAGTDPDGDNSPAGRSSWTVNYAANFTGPNYGADGAAGTGAVTYALQLTGENVPSGLYALTAAGTGQGTQIVLNQSGNTIAGSANGDTYFTITVNPANGDVTFAQSKNVWHSNTLSDDDTSTLNLTTADALKLVQTLKDGDGDTDSASINLGQGVFQIEDDGPTANNDNVSATPSTTGTADILFIVDVSGSMTGNGSAVPDVPGFDDNRLGLARYSMQQLLLNHPEILNVQFVKFDDDVDSPTSVWLTRAQALDYILEDSNFVGGGNTNYDFALAEAMSEYNNSSRPAGQADQTLVYFLSDGAPNDGDGIDDGPIDPSDNTTGDGNVTREEWEQFVTTPANDITHVFAIGLGDGVNVGNLEPVAYPNTDANAPIGDEDHVVVVPTANLADLTETLDALLGSVLTPVSGDVTDNDSFGTDGAATPKLVSVTYGLTTYTFGPATKHTIDLGAGKGSLKIEDDGGYTYTPPPAEGADGAPFFVEYVIRDRDGDTSTGKINIDLTVPPTTNNVFASGNEDNTAGIPVVLTGSDSDGTVASFKITSLPANGTLYADVGLTNPIEVNELVSATINTATVYFVPNANYNGKTTFDYTAIDNEGAEDATPATAEITVNPVNDAPVIGGMGGILPYTENGPAVIIDSSVTVADIDSANFNGGSLTVAFTLNGTTADQLAISHQGTGNGEISVSGSNVSYNPPGGAPNAVIGTWSGGNNGIPLVILFNGNATPEAVDALIQRITYANTSENPSTADRTVTFTLVDGDGTANGGSDIGTAIATVTVSPLNDAPTTSDTSPSGNEDAASIQINLSGSDVDGSVASFKITSLPTNGKLYSDATLLNQIALNTTVGAIANAAAVFFVPDPNFFGAVNFQYASIDNFGLQDGTPATASITVNPVSDPTAAIPDSIITAINDDATFAVPHWALLANDSDPDGSLSINQIVSFDGTNFDNVTTGGGNVTINTDGPFDAGDTAQFTYKATDGTSSANATVTVSAVADANIAGTDNAEIIVDNDNAHTINAGKGNDIVFGNDGNDTINGGEGDDILDGGEGGDTLDGGKGADTFDVDDGNDTIVYNAVENLDAADVVTGFDNEANGGHDTVNLDALFDALSVGTNQRADRVSVVDVGSNTELRVDLDNNGSDETTILIFQGIGGTASFTFGNDADNDIKLGTSS
jgi:VCBS repeat-containing protein